MPHELERMVLVLVGDGLEEEAVQTLLEREVDHGLDRVQAALARDLGHRPMRPVYRVEDKDPLVRGRPRTSGSSSSTRWRGRIGRWPRSRASAAWTRSRP